jgi:cell division protein FtsL
MIVEEVEEIETRIQDTETRISEMEAKLADLNLTERVTAVRHPV